MTEQNTNAIERDEATIAHLAAAEREVHAAMESMPNHIDLEGR